MHNNLKRLQKSNLLFVVPQAPAYIVPASVNDYLYQENLPELTELTICFWFKGQPDVDKGKDCLVSIATTGNFSFVIFYQRCYLTLAFCKASSLSNKIIHLNFRARERLFNPMESRVQYAPVGIPQEMVFRLFWHK